MKYQRPKGTTDIIPGESEKWQSVEEKARKLFNKYRYNEIRTPIFESFEVFSRTSGETSDIVTKEMYDFFDKGDRHITLRPEGTAGVVRAYVENKLYGPEIQKPFKTFYMGPMFRYERPQAGRLREFHQIGVEAFGVDNPALDVEVMSMAVELLHSFGLKNLKLAINTLGDIESRTNYRNALVEYLEPFETQLSDDSKERLHKNPLRVLDSKDQNDQKIVADAPDILDYLTPDAQQHFDKVKMLLDTLGISYEIDSNMVRGLDYYNHTIFEIMSNSKAFGGKWTTVCAGGRYNGLVEQLGGPETPGIGFGLGVERLLLVLDAEGINLKPDNGLDVYIVGIGEETLSGTMKLVHAIRKAGFSAERDYLDRKPKGQFKAASRLGAKYTLTVGEEELTTGKANLKEMTSGQEIAVSLSDIQTNFGEVIRNFNSVKGE
ncbi:histidine--tRNA ligase [Liquorilactobacillus mali]|uniref:Histidine--tRNA ligase n=1 Tax=Liquorilactobacillus mali KCTC 3596 = DSM 20444 TaxID=1046596 RepID=J0L4V7_9LACO|nr:histidine--tRNA ligase [Liquorilactobacillus mali]EJE98571.1 histidyl-tRNA ligase [Liquorilactobacillus mali KCTC 3596 = DSM 20444]KRN10906.1 histidyl-tRNA synthetase [Liquorilactobacillus mali KCTC 3596 = DSM 20444]MDC7952124.1 histidine--tRNA ligase [Liquorilactobacillus mali]QFQ74786.1 histidine--tRNA ligase [Liquorilactobacillus mali]